MMAKNSQKNKIKKSNNLKKIIKKCQVLELHRFLLIFSPCIENKFNNTNRFLSTRKDNTFYTTLLHIICYNIIKTYYSYQDRILRKLIFFYNIKI